MRMYFDSQNRTRHFKWQRVTCKVCKEEGKNSASYLRFIVFRFRIYFICAIYCTPTDFSPRFVIATDDMTVQTHGALSNYLILFSHLDGLVQSVSICATKLAVTQVCLIFFVTFLVTAPRHRRQDNWYNQLLIVIQSIRKIRTYYKGAPPHKTCSHVLGNVVFKRKYALREVRG